MTESFLVDFRLSDAHPESTYRIVAIDGPEHIEQRLVALGFTCGAPVKLVNRTLGRQTLAVCVDGIGMLLRAEEAASIAVSSGPACLPGGVEA